MSKYLSCFLWFVCLCAPAFAQKGGLQSLDTQRFKAMFEKDTSFLKKVLADDLVYTHSNGLVESKQAHLAAISGGKTVYKRMESESMELRKYGKTLIINGVIKAKGSLNGNDFDIRLRYTDVYIRHRGTWLLHTWQSTKLP